MIRTMRLGLAVLLLGVTGAAMAAAPMAALRVCADPGNMPFSNNRGEGFEQKIAQVIADSLGTTVQYYYRPGIERGLTRTTLAADQCDLMLDLTRDAQGVLSTSPLYRTTFVLATRTDRNLDFKSLDDPRLKTLTVGVYQTSAIREALEAHDVRSNTVVHYLSHDADTNPEDEPVYQVKQVVDGELDVAAVWGPFAGYYKAMKHAPLTIQPVNLMEDEVPMEFDMTLAVRTQNRDFRDQIENTLKQQKDKIRTILVDFGVPLVKCDDCIIDGDLPSHGPYAAVKQPQYHGPAIQNVTLAMLDDWLAHGAKLSVELNNAVLAGDPVRVSYLIEKKHADINARDPQGYTPLLNAVRIMSADMVTYLVEHNADVSRTDNDGWTPIMTAAWLDDGELVQYLAAHKADPNARNPSGLTPLAIASQYGKEVAVVALVKAGCDVNQRIGSGYTPLMLAVAGRSDRSARALLDHGADVNAKNSGGITALMIAAAANQADLASLLIKSGADPAAKNEEGKTALGIARDKGSDAVIKILEPPAAASGMSSS
ncbi:MAG TPA: quinoprotein dehydrogenase-associated putative ABC transporter substrate-binding protein [Steroidobacteraceae bacterium]|nr:quinoprotein dehydrogenase-associated putative ABC transporter substrate-binding protein [Steroidobacteraceae bacterium]